MRPIVTAIAGSPSFAWESAYDRASSRIAAQESVEILDRRYVRADLANSVDLLVRLLDADQLNSDNCLRLIDRDIRNQEATPALGLLYVVLSPLDNAQDAWLRSVLDSADGLGSRWSDSATNPEELEVLVGAVLEGVINQRRRHYAIDSLQSAAGQIIDEYLPATPSVAARPLRPSTFGMKGKI